MTYFRAIFLLTICVRFVITISYRDLIKVFTNRTVFDDLYFLRNDDLVGSQCAAHSRIYYQAYRDNEDWALKMFDSSSKLQAGILSGNIANFGDFDQCLSIKGGPGPGPVQGKYCQIYFQFQNVTKFMLFDFMWSVCVPNTCTEPEIARHYEQVFSDVDFVQLPYNNCVDQEKHEKLYTYDPTDWIIIFVLSTLIVVTIISTFLNGKFKNLEEFSIVNNWTKFITVTNNDQFSILHGIRVISMLWIILYHRYEINLKYYPLLNSNEIDQWYHSIKSFLIADPIIVDTFFFIGGFLVSHGFHRMQQSTTNCSFRRKFTIYYLHRYVRISISLIVMTMIQITLIFQISSGPLWYNFVHDERSVCKKNWVPLVLFLQNYIFSDHMCLDHTWYLCVDMQLFWLSPLILYPLYTKSIFGKVPIIITTILSITIPFWYILDSPNIDLQLPYVAYFETHLHSSSWMMGLLFHQLTRNQEHKKLKKVNAYFGWTFTLLATLYALFGKYYLLNYHHENDDKRLLTALYVIGSRVLWSLITFWFLSANVFNHSAKLTTFLSLKSFRVLSKLTYPMYIAHVTIQMTRASIQRSSEYFSDLNMMYVYFGDLFFTFIFSIVLMILFEMPILAFSNKFLKY